MIIFLFCLTIAFSTARNVLSKNISQLSFGTKRFYLSQAVLFFLGGIALILFSENISKGISYETLFYSVIYGTLLITSQYFYTISLKNGNIGICSIIYSLGFIFPTISGSLFWDEYVSFWNVVGILFVFPAIAISGMDGCDSKKKSGNKGYIVPLIIAMISSGGLGVMQKIQQKSAHSDEMEIFVIVAFVFASLVSMIFYLFAKKENEKTSGNMLRISAIVGVSFGISNLLNTSLAGKLDSAVFFPVLNISRIIVSMILGIAFYNEKISKKDIYVLALGIASIIFITVL